MASCRLTGGDPARRERKYLAYWVKRPEGWRVVAYRQQVREAGEVSKEMMPPSLPPFSAEPITDPEVMQNPPSKRRRRREELSPTVRRRSA